MERKEAKNSCLQNTCQDPVIFLHPVPKHCKGAISTCRTFDETIDARSWTNIPIVATKSNTMSLRRLLCSRVKFDKNVDHRHGSHEPQIRRIVATQSLDYGVPEPRPMSPESPIDRRRPALDSVLCSKPRLNGTSLNDSFSFQALEADSEDEAEQILEIELSAGMLLEEESVPSLASPQFHVHGNSAPSRTIDQRQNPSMDLGSLEEVVPRGPAYSEIYSDDSQSRDFAPRSSCLRRDNRNSWFLRSERAAADGSFADEGDDEHDRTMHAVVFVTT